MTYLGGMMVFKPNTVLVVGAGASAEVGMPVGRGLAEQIHSHANIESWRNPPEEHFVLVQAMVQKYTPQGMNDAMAKMRSIALGIVSARSIDAYLDRMSADPQLVEIGKLLIAYFILRNESWSHLKVAKATEGQLDLSETRNTWLSEFVLTLFDQVRLENLMTIASQVQIICFNYDRCLERYLQEALRVGYRLDAADADRVVSAFTILRPYGGLGRLPPSPMGYGPAYVGFGAKVEAATLWEMAGRIRTFTERHEQGDPVLQAIHKVLSDADQVVFLGFGYQRQNLELLRIQRDRTLPRARDVYASGLGVPDEQRETVSQELALTMGMKRTSIDRVHLAINATCAKLFEIHGRNLVEGLN